MDLPILEDAVALLARHLLGEPVCVLPVNPQVALDLAREGALWALPQLIVLKLSLTARISCISLFLCVKFTLLIHGDHSHCSQPPIDIKIRSSVLV